MSQLFLLLTLLLLQINTQVLSAQILRNLIDGWESYKEECHHNNTIEPPATGLVCNRTLDRFACWPDGQPNTVVNVSCPWYLPWHSQVKHGHVFRECGADGQWLPSKNMSECTQGEYDEMYGKILNGFRVMYTVGYSLSLAALVLALGILLAFRKLHCMRNYIHINLFASFILRALSILVKDELLYMPPMNISQHEDELEVWINNSKTQSQMGCRTALVMMQYSIVANYNWLLVEGIYLHNLLLVTVFTERNYFNIYLCIGWVAPLLFVVPWVTLRYLYDNTECWEQNNNIGIWWVIRSTTMLAILINFFIFIRIIQILVSKLQSHQMRYTDYKFRLAKSTLTLIPLLGMHEVVFASLTDDFTQGPMRLVKLFFDLFLNSFQGLLVAILYCFVNAEVQSELLKNWKRWKLGKDIEEEYRHTYSQTPHGKNGSTANSAADTADCSASAAITAGEKHKLVSSYQNGTGKTKHVLQPPEAPDRGTNSLAEDIRLEDKARYYAFPPKTSESNF
ncbi:glucagon receptor isoform X2 [Amia ocellicauda]|uniref:glucagon receptor isoform X2 n=1 Tax=Amia ocellicauda TaxID=2972642 RepID=UPI00346395BA